MHLLDLLPPEKPLSYTIKPAIERPIYRNSYSLSKKN